MNTLDIPLLRLQNTGLSDSPFPTAASAVSHLGAFQAQDFAAAKWGLGLRIRGSTDKDIEEAFNRGEILRTHVMRPTWHFVLPGDIHWMVELTAPRVKAILAHYDRKLGLDDDLYARSNAAIVRALEGHTHLTRQDLKTVLEGVGIRTDVQRLAHIISRAELDGLVCSGPRRGKQFTYALLDERVEHPRRIPKEEALARLALAYFTSHGPAQLADFSWWSGLDRVDAKSGLDSVSSKLNKATIDGRTYWYPPRRDAVSAVSRSAFLLSVYDEYTIAYRDRSSISDERGIERMISTGNAMTAVIILDGRLAGTWKRKPVRDGVEIMLNPFRKLTGEEREALGREAHRYGEFFGIPAELAFGP